MLNGSAITTDYSGNVIYENGIQKLLLTEEGYVNLANSNTYYCYLKDYQGNNRVVINSSGTVQETNHYYPFGGVFSTSTNVQPYKYNGKELDTKNGLNWYDYGARHYDATLGRWFAVDPLAEKYYSTSLYGYCLNNPVGAIDHGGKLVIFINGFHNGFQGGKPSYWGTKQGQFDKAVMKHFNDYNSLYYDGSLGGIFGLSKQLAFSNYNSDIRYSAGYNKGEQDVEKILSSLARDKNGNIIESLKLVTHSMGGSYGKGLAQAIMDYVSENVESFSGLTISEYDFAPFQSYQQKSVKGVDTYQYSHLFDAVAWSFDIEGASQMPTKSYLNKGHSIGDFYEYIMTLPEGRCRIENGKIVID